MYVVLQQYYDQVVVFSKGLHFIFSSLPSSEISPIWKPTKQYSTTKTAELAAALFRSIVRIKLVPAREGGPNRFEVLASWTGDLTKYHTVIYDEPYWHTSLFSYWSWKQGYFLFSPKLLMAISKRLHFISLPWPVYISVLSHYKYEAYYLSCEPQSTFYLTDRRMLKQAIQSRSVKLFV